MLEPSYTDKKSPNQSLLITGCILGALTLIFTVLGVVLGIKLYIKRREKKRLIQKGYNDLFALQYNNDQPINTDEKVDDLNNIRQMLGPNSAFLLSVQEALKSDSHV